MNLESSSRDDAPAPARPPLSCSILALLDYDMDNYDQAFVIRQLDTPLQQEDDDRRRNELVCFNKPKPKRNPIRWSFALPTSSTGTLYMFPIGAASAAVKPLCAYQFDFRTPFLQKISSPGNNAEVYANAVNLGERIYFLERPTSASKTVFKCYDPTLATWKPLKPFPHPPFDCLINATAVLGDDTILFIIASLSTSGSYFLDVASRDIWAYSVIRDEWYVVEFKDKLCCRIIGEAVVVNGTIYALTDVQGDLVLALSFERKQKDDGNLVFKCSLQSTILVTGFEPVLSNEKTWTRSSHLVHLEENLFCIVDSCEPKNFKGYQPIQVSYINLEGEKMIRIDGCVHRLKIEGMDHFFPLHCFPLPKCMTTALEGKGLVFDLNPFTSKQDKANGDREGVYLRNLPRNVTAQHLEKLKKFGPIMEEGIRIWKYKKGNRLAYVEFESATSKQRAIEASTIQIGHLIAEIFEKPPRTLGEEVPVGKK